MHGGYTTCNGIKTKGADVANGENKTDGTIMANDPHIMRGRKGEKMEEQYRPMWDLNKTDEGEHCQNCKKAYNTVYTVPDDLWKEVRDKFVTTNKESDKSGLLCPHCFDMMATAIGRQAHWMVGEIYELRDEKIERLVNKFLVWQLPSSVCSDMCVTKSGEQQRTGTNLLTASEAKQMFEYLLSDLA